MNPTSNRAKTQAWGKPGRGRDDHQLIERLGLSKNGGSLRNKINSISTGNPIYKEAIKIGEKLLESVRLPQ